ncbi:SPOR domain-containing protein [Psychroflexus montanilacus]|uniref:SPOR domain-containing protein n=1 Tax=Psychroflexus montanilacus TaxID=2873598 RepID=UPI001CCFBAF0|nr:SPOR domain-containing protein [Psychroflexus montanilacus]MBZ9653081.1 SPOR domain-containing protein [Psychroflexus montanilacus]
MPILTEQELQDIVNKETEANAKLEEKDEQLRESYREKERIRTQRRGFLASTVILGILFLALLFTVLFQPYLLQLDNGIQLADDEEVVKKSTLKNYQDKVVELESQQESNSPLDLDEFYAVQLGAFKKFNTKLSSDSYSIVHNGSYKDFNLYTLGVFETAEEAEKLRNVVRQLNFKDAFVGYYKDGERVKSNY